MGFEMRFGGVGWIVVELENYGFMFVGWVNFMN